MRIRTLLKSGVLGVFGVHDSLKASNDAAFSDGTPDAQGPNTLCSEHQSCSAPAPLTRTPPLPFPAGHVDVQRTQQTPSAEQSARTRGAGGNDGETLQNGVPSSSTHRWWLVPDDENPNRLLWEWNPWVTDDIDELFERVGNRTASDEDHELFDACMLDRFIHRVGAGQPVEPWIMESLADAFTKVLFGGEWNDEVRLPGRPVTLVRPWRDERDLKIYCDVANGINLQGLKAAEAISLAADRYAVSFETARAGYYRWKERLSKKRGKP